MPKVKELRDFLKNWLNKGLPIIADDWGNPGFRP